MPTSKRPSEKAPKRVPKLAAKPRVAKKHAPARPAAKRVEKLVPVPPPAVKAAPIPVPAPVEKAASVPPVVVAAVAAPAAVELVPQAESLGAPALPPRLVELFRLSRLEQRVVLHLLMSPAPVAVSALAERLELEIAETIALLGLERSLRARALVETEGRGLTWLLPSDLLTVGRGLHLLCNETEKPAVDDATLFAGHAPGISYFAAPPPGTSWAQELLGEKRPAAIADIVRDHLGSGQAVALWLGGAGPSDTMPLIQALRARLQRPVVLIDGATLFDWPELFATLRRVRRDADLRGAAVVVSDAKQLGGAWRALGQPRPAGQTAPVILCQSEANPPVAKLPQGGAGETPLVPAMASLVRTPPPPAANANHSAAEDEKEDPAVLASREEARRRAALDAARAMGRPIPAEFSEPSKPVVAPTPVPAKPAPGYRQPPRAVEPPPVEPPPVEPEPMPAGARAGNPRLAAALARAGLPPPGSEAYRSEEYARRPPPPAAAAPAAPPVPLPPVEVAAPVEPAAAPAAAPSAAPEPEVEEGPPMELEEGAPLDEIIRVARLTPSNAQRQEILRQLSGKRVPSVIQLFRTSVSSAHPGVRAAAEAGMTSIFGGNWNRTRTIAPPVQPPRSDDGGRGPGGAI